MAQIRLQATTRLQLFHALTTIIVNLAVFIYLLRTDHLLFVGHFTSLLVPFYIIFELLKYLYIRSVYKVTGLTREGAFAAKHKRTVFGFNVFRASFRFAALQIASVLIFAFICIILGAPALSHYEQTFSLSSLLTTLSIFQLTLLVGAQDTVAIWFAEKFTLNTTIDNVYLNVLKDTAVGAILGSWASSVVMPLDWDRPWQTYPIPNVVGALLGQSFACSYILAKLGVEKIRAKLKKKSFF